MKKALAAATLLIMVSAFTFANGTQENPAQGTWWHGNGRFSGQDRTAPGAIQRPLQGEERTKTGTLKLVDGSQPELVTKDGTYTLMYPYMYANSVQLKDGQEITVKGYDAPAYRWNNTTSNEKRLMVTEATINGKEYKIDRSAFRHMRGKGNRSGGNRMGGHGSRGGYGSQRGGGRW